MRINVCIGITSVLLAYDYITYHSVGNKHTYIGSLSHSFSPILNINKYSLYVNHQLVQTPLSYKLQTDIFTVISVIYKNMFSVLT